MNRRIFLQSSAAAVAVGAVSGGWTAMGADKPKPGDSDLLRGMVRANDEQIPSLLARQERRAGHESLGGLPNEFGIYTASGTGGFIASVAGAACAPASKY